MLCFLALAVQVASAGTLTISEEDPFYGDYVISTLDASGGYERVISPQRHLERDVILGQSFTADDYFDLRSITFAIETDEKHVINIHDSPRAPKIELALVKFVDGGDTRLVRQESFSLAGMNYSGLRYATLTFDTPIPIKAGQQYGIGIWFNREFIWKWCFPIHRSAMMDDLHPGGAAFFLSRTASERDASKYPLIEPWSHGRPNPLDHAFGLSERGIESSAEPEIIVAAAPAQAAEIADIPPAVGSPAGASKVDQTPSSKSSPPAEVDYVVVLLASAALGLGVGFGAVALIFKRMNAKQVAAPIDEAGEVTSRELIFRVVESAPAPVSNPPPAKAKKAMVKPAKIPPQVTPELEEETSSKPPEGSGFEDIDPEDLDVGSMRKIIESKRKHYKKIDLHTE